MRVAARTQAFTLFCNGKTLAEAAEAVGVHRSTTERWSREFHWRIHRQRVWNDTREQIIKERAGRFALKESHIADKIQNLIAEACAESQAYQAGKLPARARKYSTRDLVNLFKASVHAEALRCRRFSEIDE